jgi:methylthioribose-1-phosphate isomerase
MMAQSTASLPFPFPTVSYREGTVVLIDQTLLPAALSWRVCRDIPSLCLAIRELAVRGAPAIGIAAAYGLVMSWEHAAERLGSSAAILDQFQADRRALAATRPTAVNLFWALDRVEALAAACVDRGEEPTRVLDRLKAEADRILAEDLQMCRQLGRAGAELLPDPATVVTHCNAGGLATGGYGTALGVVYAAQEAGKQVRVFADETRPLLQGARLTAWELQARGVPVTLMCEGAAATLLRSGQVDAVITGADRIASNGDTANKIGTYPLAVLAREHGVPFYVAAPASTFDPHTAAGSGIEVEQRAAEEVVALAGHRVAPAGTAAFNPAFDVTPAGLVAGFITEFGVRRPPFGESLRDVLAAAAGAGAGEA